MMSKSVLLVVDVQKALIEKHPYNETKFLENIKRLVAVSRESGTEVVFVRHDDGKGEELEYGAEGWEICREVAPQNDERIFDKRYNSAFLGTGLKEYLYRKDIGTLILVGMQTEYCIDASCKSAFEQGLKVVIPEETNTTFDNEYLSGQKLYEFYNLKIWKNRFAEVVPVEEALGFLAD